MKDKKIKVLVVPSDRSGVGYYRSTSPHLHLEKLFPNDFHIDIDYSPNLISDEWLKQYDIIHYHRSLGPYELMDELIQRIKNLGVVTIMDLDDYWSPDMNHPAFHTIKKNELDKKIRNNLKVAENITTTTPIFAKEIKKINKNVKVLANGINPKEKQFIPNPEPSDKIRIGWLGGSCMTPDTEILTNEGWKRFDSLNQTEDVATLNTNTNELEFHKPTGYICEPFEGDLNCAKNGLVEYEVTPNHNMFASIAKNLTHKKLDLKLIQSSDLYGKNFHIKRDAIWVGKEQITFRLPNLEYEYAGYESEIDKIIKNKNKKINKMFEKYGSDRNINMDDWLAFFGFWMAEGWTSKTKGLHQVGIAQSKDNEYLEIMFDILTNMGFNPKYTKDKKQLRVFDKQLWDYLSNFGQANEKFIPNEIMKLSPRQLNIFLKWFIKGDGHVENDKYNRIRGFTSSPLLANNLQEIALKLGITATITNRGKRTSHIKGVKIINQFDSLVINFGKHPSISKHNKTTPLVKSDNQFKKKYKGNVYCVEVPNHIIYVRRNGKPMWIGNSHKADLKLLTNVASKLKTDNLLDKVQFVICGFDIRGKVNLFNKQTGEESQRDILPNETVWVEYEKIFTNNYQTISPEYREHLKRFVTEEFEGIENEPYRRVWTKPVNSYATNYNLFDIALAPLVENTFNKVKCIVGDSLISTTDGFIKIGDIVESELNIKTELGGVTNKVINYFKYCNRETVKIKTKNGFTIEGTPHHKIYFKGEWIQLDELVVGDNIELTKPTFLQNNYQEITYPMLLTKNNENKVDPSCDTMLPRIKINEDWGRLLGYLLGDGHIGGKSNISISYDKRHTDVINDGMKLFKSIGLNPKLCEKTIDKRCNRNLSKEGFGIDIKLTSKTFVSIARKYNLIGKNGKIYRVPNVILQSPKSVIREFLKGLFEADGTVGRHSSVSLTSKDLKFIEQVQILLLGFSIEGRIGKTLNKYYNISLKRVGSEIFEKEIGFISKHKKELLNEFVNGKRSNNQHIPNFKDAIIEITRDVNDVYDIEVDNVHSYNANGIKNHNSQLKVIESGFHKKALIAQNFGPYTIDMENARLKGGEIDLTKNGFLIDSGKNHKAWYQYLKILVQNPEMIKIFGDNLHKTVSEKYSLDTITKDRAEYYKTLVLNNKK